MRLHDNTLAFVHLLGNRSELIGSLVALLLDRTDDRRLLGAIGSDDALCFLVGVLLLLLCGCKHDPPWTIRKKEYGE